MRSKLLTGITTGLIIGAAASMMVAPNMDRRTRRRMKKSASKMKNMALGMYDGMMGMMK